MNARVLDGRLIAADIKNQLRDKLTLLKKRPGLAVILVGQDPASKIYVENKRKACEEVGIISYSFNLNNDLTTQELHRLVLELNDDPSVDGILIQLPLPSSIDKTFILESINPLKDVDGFHPYNMGRLAQGSPFLRPCTPYGIIQLLNAYDISIKGKQAVVIGESTIVGRPMMLEFLNAKATTTICHRHTKNLKEQVQKADIVVLAAGVCDLIKPEWLHHQHIIVDVGIHRLSEGHIRGDVDFDAAKRIVAAITPVPGGVGPMTVATLLQNTVMAFDGNAQIGKY